MLENLKRADPTVEESIWEAARIKNVVFERQPTQMEAQYRRLVQKLGGVKQALETIKQGCGFHILLLESR